MTERVVDLLELVEVDEEQRGEPLGMMRILQQPLDLVVKADPVGQRRELVVTGEMADAGFRIGAFGDVFQQQHRAAAGHRLERPGQGAAARGIRIGGDDLADPRMLDLGQDVVAALRRDRPGGNAGRRDIGGSGAALDEVLGQGHQLAEAVVHHCKAAVGAEHAQPVRHVVERGVELARQRGFAEARGQRLDEDRMQAEVDVLEPDEEEHQQDGKTDVVEAAVQQQGERHRTAGQCDVPLDHPGLPVIAGGAARGVADADGDTEHVGDRIVVVVDDDEGPHTEHGRIAQRADPVTRLQVLGLFE
ncbi:hypothetical protein ACVIG9_007823 [Bradyrhizobium ottawaense]